MNKLKAKIQMAREDLDHAPVVGRFIRRSRKITLPGFQHMPLYDVMRFYFESLGKGIIFQRAAALTYRVFIALLPMILALFSFISYLGDNVQNALLSLIESIMPVYAWPVVSNMITEVITIQNGTLSSFMLVVGIYFTIICTNGLLVAMNTAYFEEEKRNFFKQLWMSFVLMVIFFFVIVIVVMLFITASVAMNYVHRHFTMTSDKGYFYLIHGLKWVMTYVSIYFLVSILYYIAPVQKKYYRFFSAGSSACTILMVLLLWVLNIYFSNFTNYNLIYGSLGALFAVLLWINWSSVILLIGYDLNVSIAKAKENNLEQKSKGNT